MLNRYLVCDRLNTLVTKITTLEFRRDLYVVPKKRVLDWKFYQSCYSYNSIKGTCSIKQPGLEFFKKSL